MSDTILLPPELFDALHLSALANGGVGEGTTGDDESPVCAFGHAEWLDRGKVDPCAASLSPMEGRLIRAGFDGIGADVRLRKAGVKFPRRIPFTRWVRIVGVDVRDA